MVIDADDTDLEQGYWIEGFMAEKYIAVNGDADTICKLLIEFEDDDKVTLYTGEAMDLGGGYVLTPTDIDLEGDKVIMQLERDGVVLDTEVVDTGYGDPVYTYTEDIGNNDDVPVFSCLVDAVFRGTDDNIVQLMYLFLIDNNVMEIDSGDTYGEMEVRTASATKVVLCNEDNTIDLDSDSTERIMGDMYFRIADDDNVLRFYPFVRYGFNTINCPTCEPCPICPEPDPCPEPVCPDCEPCPTITPCEPCPTPTVGAIKDSDKAETVSTGIAVIVGGLLGIIGTWLFMAGKK